MRFGDIAFMDYLKFKSGTDVRGTAVNGDFTPEVAANIAAAFAFVFDCKKVAVGRDSRITGPQICDAVTDALIGCGCPSFRLRLVFYAVHVYDDAVSVYKGRWSYYDYR